MIFIFKEMITLANLLVKDNFIASVSLLHIRVQGACFILLSMSDPIRAPGT